MRAEPTPQPDRQHARNRVRQPRKTLTDQDRAEWASYAAQIRPLPGHAALPAPTPAKPPVQQTAANAQTFPRARFRAPSQHLTIGAAPAGLDKSTWHRFQAGRLPVDRRLDLHAHTAHHAYTRFEQVLSAAAAQGLRCIEVITGRGAGELGGVLKRELPLWINLPHLRPLILAASHPHAANTGSVRLLLRRTPPSASR
jgi:DNA-nicking Smr family endonuclease